MISFAPPVFRGWFPWAAVRDERSHDPAFDEAGAYLLAHFEGAPPEEVQLDDRRIFYVGETHGRTRSLRARLIDFGNSAGFFGEQRPGHYAAWSFPEKVNVPSSQVYVALCPFPGEGLPRATRGIFPTLVEAQVLWLYTSAHDCLPKLNNSGKQVGEPPEFPALAPEMLERMFEDDPRAAAESLLTTFAQHLGYASRPVRRVTEDGWEGVERGVSKGWRLSLWWHPTERSVLLWHSDGTEPAWFGSAPEEQAVTSAVELDRLLRRFWQRWHTE